MNNLAQPQNATFAQDGTHKDDTPLQGNNSEKLLIDKNELLFRLTTARSTALGTQSHNPQEVIEVFNAIIDLIESFDTEAGQQKRGKWLKWEQMFHTTAIHPNQKLGVFCSVCKKYADNDFDYCPNCGAKMDCEDNV